MKCEVFHSYPIFYESDDEEENERFNLRPIFEKSEREYEDDILDLFSALNFSGYSTSQTKCLLKNIWLKMFHYW